MFNSNPNLLPVKVSERNIVVEEFLVAAGIGAGTNYIYERANHTPTCWAVIVPALYGALADDNKLKGLLVGAAGGVIGMLLEMGFIDRPESHHGY